VDCHDTDPGVTVASSCRPARMRWDSDLGLSSGKAYGEEIR
jgi:hypothetical protein